jgi:hypothetical protein
VATLCITGGGGGALAADMFAIWATCAGSIAMLMGRWLRGGEYGGGGGGDAGLNVSRPRLTCPIMEKSGYSR